METVAAARSFWRDRVNWCCNAAMAAYGLAMTVLGTLLPWFLKELSLDATHAGSLFFWLNGGALAATGLAGILFDRSSPRWVLAWAQYTMAAGILAIAAAGGYLSLALACFLLGVGGGGTNLAANALVASRAPGQEGASLNRLGLFYGVGSFALPFLAAALLPAWGWRLFLAAAATVALVPAIAVSALSPISTRTGAGATLSGFDWGPAFRHTRLFWLGLLLLFEAGNETIVGGWLTTYLVRETGASEAEAALWLGLFWATLIGGRGLGAVALRHWSPTRLVLVGALTSSGLVGCFVLASGAVAMGCILLAGLAMAPIFPTVFAQGIEVLPARPGTVLGLLMTAALLGSMTLPWAAGWLMETAGPGAALLLAGFGFLLVAGAQVMASGRRVRSGRNPKKA